MGSYKSKALNKLARGLTYPGREEQDEKREPPKDMKNTQTGFSAVMAMVLLFGAVMIWNPVPIEAQAPASTPASGHAAASYPDQRPRRHVNPNPPPDKPFVFTVEEYAMAQEDAGRVIEESGGGEAAHEAVLALMKKGKARLKTVMSLAETNMQRTVVESCDEVRYAAGFDLAAAGAPIIHDTCDVGDSLEIEPTLGETKDEQTICDLNFVLKRVRLRGFLDVNSDGGESRAKAQPRFETDKITTAISAPMGQNVLLGTLSDPPRFDEDANGGVGREVRLVFGRPDWVSWSAVAKAKALSVPMEYEYIPDPDGPNPGWPRTLGFEFSFYSLDRDAARQILSEGFNDESCYAAVKGLVDEHEARLERVTVLTGKSGQRALVQELDQVPYANHVVSATNSTAAPGWEPPIKTGPFYARDAGLIMEIEPTLALGTVDINMVPQLVSYEGVLETPGSAVKSESQPVFERRKVVTELRALLGLHTFIGTFSHPGDDGVNGRKDTGRVWLGFVRPTI
jgi:hypothetical protein